MTDLSQFRQRAISSSITKSQWDVAKELRCAADQVFIGTIEDSQSLPIADGTFLFTEYAVMVTEAIAPAPGEGGRAGSRLTVLRPGGSIRVEETAITAFISDVPRLETGASYLFFENGVPATGATRSAHADGTFAVSNDSVRSLTSVQTLGGDLAKGTRKDLFLNAVRAVGPCK